MFNKFRLHPLCAAIVLASGVHVAHAQQTEEDTDRFNLGSIEVINVEGQQSGNWSAPFQASIDAEQLRLFERNNVSDALSLIPGVTIQNVGARSEKLVYIRGFNSRQVPLFIDGVPVYVPYDGNFDLSRILTFDIAEISVGKGFSSVLYGANTLGGSINVVSRRPREGFHGSLRSSVNFNNDDDRDAQNHVLTLENATQLWYAQANVSWSDQDSFNLPKDFVPTAAQGKGERVNSGTEDMKLSLKFGYTPNATDEYALSYQRQEGDKNTPPYAGRANITPRYWQWPDYDKESLYFISRTALGQTEYLRTRVYYDTFYNLLRSFDDNTYTGQTRPYAFNSVYDDYSYGASFELGSNRIDNHALRAGLQYKRDMHREHDLGMPTEKMEDSVFSLGLEDTWSLTQDLSLVGGVGWDRQEGRRADDLQGTTMLEFPVASADGWNAQAALRYALSDTWNGHVSAARRTRFPTMKDRYSYRMGSAIPNPGLNPESAVNLEVGVDGNVALTSENALQLSAAVFHSRIDDSIESVTIAPTACTSAPCSQLRNIGRQENQGVEVAATITVGDWFELHGNYTYLDRENISSPTVLPLDTPQNKGFAYVQVNPIDAVSLILSTQHESSRYSSTDGLRRAGSFETVDFKTVWQALPQLRLEAGARNLGDKLYAFEEGYPEAGRSWFLTFTLQY
ncbi:MAG TPA: TonB-dependent receptor [Hyphomicrobiales bacterium]|nr:TonB-dependent receptor [Hyphomicrobiales bacterium]